MSDLNLKNVRSAYKDRSEGLNDQGKNFLFSYFVSGFDSTISGVIIISFDHKDIFES